MDSYVGETLSDAECDLIALTRFPSKVLKGESELQQICWFDYRYLHPTKRTYLFAAHYMRSYQTAYKKYIDCDAEHIIGLSRPNDPLDNDPPKNKTAKLRTPTCLWRARQVADALCIPYDFYTNQALDHLMNTRFRLAILGRNSTGKIRLNIQASSLYSDEVVEHVTDKWQAYCKARIVWPENPRFAMTESELSGQSKPHPYKLALERHIAKQIYPKIVKEHAAKTAVAKRFARKSVLEKVLQISIESDCM